MLADSERPRFSYWRLRSPRLTPVTNAPRSFKLLRSFSLTSLIACVVVVVLLASFYRQSAIADLTMIQERQHVALTQVFANTIWSAHAPLMSAIDGHISGTHLAPPVIATLRQTVLNQMRGTAVIKVKIYNLAGLTIFSTDPSEIGDDQHDDDGVTGALVGRVDSELTHHNTVNTFDHVIENRDVFSSYIPLRSAAQGAPIVGVFEIYTDVTPFLQQIAHTQLRVAIGVAFALALLYAVLFVIIRRADRILQDEALERQRAAERPWRQALTFENTYDSVIVTQCDGTIIDCNPATERIFGATRAQVLAGDLRCWYRTAAFDWLQTNLTTASACRNTSTLPFTRLDDGAGTCEVVVVPRYDEQDQLAGWIWLSHDITEQARAQTALIAACDAAEAANRAKSMFLANMSHELRTPLTAILGYSDLLEYDLSDSPLPQVTHALACIRTAGRHLLTLINDLIDLARIEAGRIELQPEAIPLADLVAEVSELVQPLMREHGNRLDVQCDAQVGLIWIDAGKLRQVLLNVLGNAAKFTDQGRITLIVTRESRRAGDWIRFTVADTGIGIAKEQVGRLFQPFMQVDNSTTRKYGGAGLGLAISSRVCVLMGGQLNVTSELGVGSVFHIVLPVHSSNETVPAASDLL